jgi:pyruvate dehydrogenase E2 component (dihydrolipoamide acetyltransferase)
VIELKLPELGENIEAVEVAAVLVKPGDRVNVDQPVVEVETEKANLEVPAPDDGVIAEILIEPGDTVQIGQTILTIDVQGAAPATEPPSPDERPAAEEPATEKPPAAEEPATEKPSAAEEPATERPAAGQANAGDGRPDARPAGPPPVEPAGPRQIGATVPAAPSVRALARELGVDLFKVQGSGPGGRISRDDVKARAKAIIQGAATEPTISPGRGSAAPELPDFAQWGPIERARLSSVRRATVASMSNAWAQVPHVTQFDHADVTQIESMRRRFNQRPDAAERKLSMTAIVIKLVAAALKQFPEFNASLDPAKEEVVYKKYIHVGVAVDTERGLLVPVIRDVDRKSLVQVATELTDLAERARSKKLGLDEMRGGSFTVSNLGGLGTTYFSPIVLWPQVAILGVGRAEQQAVWNEQRFQPRLIMPLSVSYDHRWIDGADAARFLRWLAEALEQPLLLLIDE